MLYIAILNCIINNKKDYNRLYKNLIADILKKNIMDKNKRILDAKFSRY